MKDQLLTRCETLRVMWGEKKLSAEDILDLYGDVADYNGCTVESLIGEDEETTLASLSNDVR